MPIGIVSVLNFYVTAAIVLLFQKLVKDFPFRSQMQKADRMVGIIPLWLREAKLLESF